MARPKPHLHGGQRGAALAMRISPRASKDENFRYIEIIAGETGRDKLVSILDIDPKTASERI